VPQVGDATVQRFFQEIADELANIRATGENPEALQLKFDRLKEVAVASSVPVPNTPVLASRPPSRGSSRPGSRAGSRPASVLSGTYGARPDNRQDMQFEDADEDSDDDLQSVRSGTASESSRGYPYTPTSPIPPPLASPSGTTAPLAVADKDYRSGRPTLLRGVTSPRPASVFSTATTSSTISAPTSSGTGTLGRRRSLLGRRKAAVSEQAPAESGRTSLAYERLQDAGAARSAAGTSAPLAAFAASRGPNATNSPTRLQQKNPGLGLDISHGAPQHGSSIAAPSIRSPVPSNTSAPSTPREGASPKQSWFSGLFNWKVEKHVLLSVENFSATHAEVKRLLLSSGARVFVEDAEHMGVLKCSLAEVRDGSGAKPVRFRVEFAILPMSSSSAAASPALDTTRLSAPSPALSSYSGRSTPSDGGVYATSCTIIHEKGAPAAFRRTYEELRRNWTLGGGAGGMSVPSSPAAVGLGIAR
jgi:hypothetical protein